ncbi:MAG: hypothetical protein RR248_01400 [Clostridia bacterium]
MKKNEGFILAYTIIVMILCFAICMTLVGVVSNYFTYNKAQEKILLAKVATDCKIMQFEFDCEHYTYVDDTNLTTFVQGKLGGIDIGTKKITYVANGVIVVFDYVVSGNILTLTVYSKG